MRIKGNIQWITEKPELWGLYRNRSYQAMIQKADSRRIYNVEEKPGIVYNFLEDSFEKVTDAGYVVTGILGEMWPIGAGALRKYDVDPAEITDEPMPVMTRETDTVYAAIRIPADTVFMLETEYGEKAWLHGNREGVPHDAGDYVLVCTKVAAGQIVPDFDDCGRIVNGSVFGQLYQPLRTEKGRC